MSCNICQPFTGAKVTMKELNASQYLIEKMYIASGAMHTVEEDASEAEEEKKELASLYRKHPISLVVLLLVGGFGLNVKSQKINAEFCSIF